MQAPRGLSAEEKRVKLLEIFHETVGELAPMCITDLQFFFIDEKQRDFCQVDDKGHI